MTSQLPMHLAVENTSAYLSPTSPGRDRMACGVILSSPRGQERIAYGEDLPNTPRVTCPRCLVAWDAANETNDVWATLRRNARVD